MLIVGAGSPTLADGAKQARLMNCSIGFILLLNFIHLFVFYLAVASSGGCSMQGGIC